MPFGGVSRFAMPTVKSVFGRIDQGQQPLWGVGRLCLSLRGSREPRLGKCNDSRLFCIHTKSVQITLGQGKNSRLYT